jgi:hypothetical protein
MFDTICMIESLHRQFLDMAEKIFVAEWGGGAITTRYNLSSSSTSARMM